MKKITVIFFISSLLLFFLPCLSFPANKIFEREYTYQASEADSKLSCRAIATEQVKRMLLEELGIYVESITEVRENQITKDKIVTLSAGIVETKIIEEKWDGKIFKLKARIIADPDKVIEKINDLKKDIRKLKEIEASRKRTAELLVEIEKLKQELELSKGNDAERKEYEYKFNELRAFDLYERAYIFYGTNAYDEAIECLDKAIDLMSSCGLFYELRAWCYIDKSWKYSVAKNYEKALKGFKQAIYDSGFALSLCEVQSSNSCAHELNTVAEVFLYLARTEDRMGNNETAKECFLKSLIYSTKSIRNDPTFIDGYCSLGNAHLGLKQFKKCFKAFNKAIQIDQTYINAWNGLISGYGAYKNIKDKSAPITPETTYPSMRANYLFEKENKYEDAILACNEAIELDSEDAYSFRYRGMSNMILRHYKKAIDDLSMAININPNDKDAYYYRGGAFLFIQNYKKAQLDYEKYIQLDPEESLLAQAHHFRGVCYFNLGNYKKSILASNAAININPSEPVFYRSRGAKYEILGNFEKAVSDYISAARLGDPVAQELLKSHGIDY